MLRSIQRRCRPTTTRGHLCQSVWLPVRAQNEMPARLAAGRSTAKCGNHDGKRRQSHSSAPDGAGGIRLGSVASVSKIPIQSRVRKATKRGIELKSRSGARDHYNRMNVQGHLCYPGCFRPLGQTQIPLVADTLMLYASTY